MPTLAFIFKRTFFNDVVQGIIVGAVLGYVTFQSFLIFFFVTQGFNGWTTIIGCNEPGNSILFKAACADVFSGPINVSQEAMYWTTRKDGSGQNLSGGHNYILQFPAMQLPPNNAFWSLTLGDVKNHFVQNPINRYSVSDRSGLAKNPDGSVDIYIQNTAPAGHTSNWLPAPTGNFILWMRVYLPGQEILDGKYQIPPIMEVK